MNGNKFLGITLFGAFMLNLEKLDLTKQITETLDILTAVLMLFCLLSSAYYLSKEEK